MDPLAADEVADGLARSEDPTAFRVEVSEAFVLLEGESPDGGPYWPVGGATADPTTPPE